MSRAKYYLSYAMARKSSNEVQGFRIVQNLYYIIIKFSFNINLKIQMSNVQSEKVKSRAGQLPTRTDLVDCLA